MKPFFLCLSLILILACNNDLDDNLTKAEIAGVPKNINPIEKEDALYTYLGLVAADTETELTDVGCIEFIYPFVLFRFDSEKEYLDQVSVLGNENFARILANLEEGHSIGLSYPISGNLIDGTPVSVSNNEELQESIESCIEEELEIIIGNCSAIVEECIWKVTESDAEENRYIDSFFTLREDGSVVLSIIQETETNENEEEETISEFKEEVGTWIFYFIGPDLHMNINFGPIDEDEEDEAIKNDWNFDWKVIAIGPEILEIEKFHIEIETTVEGDTEKTVTEKITLEKECEESDIEQNTESKSAQGKPAEALK